MSKNTRGIVALLLIAFGIAWLNMLAFWLLGLGTAQGDELTQSSVLLVLLSCCGSVVYFLWLAKGQEQECLAGLPGSRR